MESVVMEGKKIEDAMEEEMEVAELGLGGRN